MYPYDNFNNYNYNNYRQQQQVQTVNTNKIYVSGINDVRARILQPNSDFIFLDNDKPLMYQKVVSPSGQFEVKTFTITPYEQSEQPKQDNTIDLSAYAKTSDLEVIKSNIEALKKQIASLQSRESK